MTVLFGTETGNSQDCADRLADSIRGLGLDAESIDMGVYDPAQLSDEALVLIVTSTFGNGDPPSNAIDLHKYVGLDSTVLDGVRFGVCALGDTTYPLFAQCGRDFDERLEARGAQRITERVECDGGFDYDEPFDAFRAACIAYLQTDPTFSAGSGPVRAASDQRSTAPSAAARPRLEQDARLVARRRLSGSASGKDTWHVELEIEGALAAYQPGDCVAVAPENDSSEVDALFQWLGPEADDGARTALVRDRCLQRVSPELLGLLAP
ncbi:MAG: flavodoxin domain-containing protein, partial [Planctomycetota bacterium]